MALAALLIWSWWAFLPLVLACPITPATQTVMVTVGNEDRAMAWNHKLESVRISITDRLGYRVDTDSAGAVSYKIESPSGKQLARLSWSGSQLTCVFFDSSGQPGQPVTGPEVK